MNWAGSRLPLSGTFYLVFLPRARGSTISSSCTEAPVEITKLGLTCMLLIVSRVAVVEEGVDCGVLGWQEWPGPEKPQ